jgi:hypothetical protein
MTAGRRIGLSRTDNRDAGYLLTAPRTARLLVGLGTILLSSGGILKFRVVFFPHGFPSHSRAGAPIAGPFVLTDPQPLVRELTDLEPQAREWSDLLYQVLLDIVNSHIEPTPQ